MAATGVYDVCVVGAGMLGSAAARHASLLPGTRVCLIGPEEPQTPDKAKVWGAYYDEGRVTLSMDYLSKPFWTEAAARSISRYRPLEEETGIQFYHEVGALVVKDFNKLPNTFSNSVKIKSAHELREEFPYMAVDDNKSAGHQTQNAGYVNPRAYVKAFQKSAGLHGCDIINDVVTHVIRSTQSDGGLMHIVRYGRGMVKARKVLVATGAYTDFFALLPAGHKPKTKLMSQYVILAELGPDDLKKLRGMPSVSYDYGEKGVTPTPGGNPGNFHCYVLPPIRYPDGKVYLKLGHGPEFEYERQTLAEVRAQYVQPTPDHVRTGLTAMLTAVFPDIKPVSLKFDNCVTVNTATRLPYISMVTPGIGVALGGNGYAAKSCDELGRAAAELVVRGRWVGPGKEGACRLQTRAGAKL